MIEQAIPFQRTDEPVMEKLVDRPDRVLIAHVVLPAGQATPRHATNADVHLIVVRGSLSRSSSASSLRTSTPPAPSWPSPSRP